MIERRYCLSLVAVSLLLTGCDPETILDGAWTAGAGRPPAARHAVQPAPAAATRCWRLAQGSYVGTLTLRTEGASATGAMDWENHADATVSGTVVGAQLSLTFSYTGAKTGVIGIYRATISGNGTESLDGSTYDVALPGQVEPFSGVSVPCKTLTGCFLIEQVNRDGGRFTGTFKLEQTADAIAGSAAWANHVPGVLAGQLVDRALVLTQTFPGTEKEGLVGTYAATVSASGDDMTGGTSTSNSGDSATWAGRRAVCSP